MSGALPSTRTRLIQRGYKFHRGLNHWVILLDDGSVYLYYYGENIQIPRDSMMGKDIKEIFKEATCHQLAQPTSHPKVIHHPTYG